MAAGHSQGYSGAPGGLKGGDPRFCPVTMSWSASCHFQRMPDPASRWGYVAASIEPPYAVCRSYRRLPRASWIAVGSTGGRHTEQSGATSCRDGIGHWKRRGLGCAGAWGCDCYRALRPLGTRQPDDGRHSSSARCRYGGRRRCGTGRRSRPRWLHRRCWRSDLPLQALGLTEALDGRTRIADYRRNSLRTDCLLSGARLNIPIRVGQGVSVM